MFMIAVYIFAAIGFTIVSTLSLASACGWYLRWSDKRSLRATTSEYSHATIGSNSALQRFSHGRRYKTTLKLLDVEFGNTVLDYGAGDGHLLFMVAEAGIRAVELFAYEPVPSMFKQLCDNVAGKLSIHPVQSLMYFSSRFDRVACCEVLEHLDPSGRENVLKNIERLVDNNGLVVISVPIESGLASLLKNVARFLIGKAHPNATAVNIFRSFFRLPIERPLQDGFIPTHIGFYYQDLEREFEAADLEVVRRKFSPFPWLHRFVNSQVFYILKRR